MDDRRKTIEEITETLYSIRRKMASEMHLLFDELQITHPQWIVLYYVKKSKRINIKDLAKLLEITSSAATQIVDGLVKKGLLSRKRNREDRRILDIELSSTAKTKFKSIKNKSFNTVSTLFDVLDDNELEIFLKLNKKVASSIPDASTGQKDKK